MASGAVAIGPAGITKTLDDQLTDQSALRLCAIVNDDDIARTDIGDRVMDHLVVAGPVCSLSPLPSARASS